MTFKPKHTLLLLALAAPFAAHAQSRDYDDRWYVTAGAGANHSDSARDTENSAFGTIGVGKFINPNWSVDLEGNYQNPKANRDENLNFSQYGLSVDARRHFRSDNRAVNPYIVGGVGYQRAEEEFDAFPNPVSPGRDKREYATAKLGAGLQWDMDRASVRGEIAARHSFDSDSLIAPGESGFTDTVASLAVVVPLGARAAPPAPPVAPVAPPAPPRAVTPECPPVSGSQTTRGPDGCPVAITIDLRGVNFGFDQHTITSDSRSTLDEAAEILRRYPELKVEVAGHTDSIGSEQYNQQLSERRASAVYDYLVQKGIDRSRLSGPTGYGETRPIAPNTNADGSDNPQGRAQNRRTELNVD